MSDDMHPLGVDPRHRVKWRLNAESAVFGVSVPQISNGDDADIISSKPQTR